MRAMRFSIFTWAGLLSASTAAIAGPVPATAPSGGAAPAVTAADAVDSVREGTHFVGRTGHLTHTANGQQAIIAFDNDGGLTNSPPMIVQPNLNLFSMESVNAKAGTVNFRVSGTVTEYKGRNYILVDSAQTTLAPPMPAVPRGTQPAKPNESPSPQTPTPTATAVQTAKPATAAVMGDSANTKMEELLAPSPNAGRDLPPAFEPVPALNATSGTAAVAPDAPVLKVLREGTHLINRIGRLNHSPDGSQAIFTFDADGKAMSDPPIIILPNLKLALIEGAVLGRAGDLHFRISGTVTEYKGRNYILLDKAVAIADVEAQF